MSIDNDMSDMSAADVIDRLDLAPHPEGGWFRETFRQPPPEGGRGLATAILSLLEAGQRSHWDRVDAAELWLWHTGSPLTLAVVDRAITRAYRLGSDLIAGEVVQALFPVNQWQSAWTDTGWSLVSCVVTPAFDFGGFALAPPGWAPR